MFFFNNSPLISLLKIEFPYSSSFIYTHVFFYINTFDLVFLEGSNDTLDPQKPVWGGGRGGHGPLAPPPTLRPCLPASFKGLLLYFFFYSPFLKAQIYPLFPNNFTLITTHLSSPGLRNKHSKQSVYQKWITIYILTFSRDLVIQRDLSEEN